METLATLAMDIDVRSADPAEAKLQSLTRTAKGAEDQFGRTAAAARESAIGLGLSGTAAGQAHKTINTLVGGYVQARDALGRFTAYDGSFRMSQDATAKMLLQNARAVDALTKEQDAAARSVQRLTSAYDPLAGEVMKTNRQIAEADKLFKQGALSATQYAAATDGLKQKLANLETAQATGVKSSKALQQATLNLGRQFTDIGVSLAGGQHLGLVLIQQLPQIADGFAVAKQQGLGFKGVIAGMAAELAPFLPLLIGVGTVVGTVFGGAALAARAQNKDNKDLLDGLGLTEKQLDHLKKKGVETGVTIGDVFKGTFNYIKGAVAPTLAPVMKWFDQLFDNITKGAVTTVKVLVGGFAGAFAGIKTIWSELPAVMGDLFASGANLAISAIEKLLNFATSGINTLIEKANAVSAKVNGPQLGALGTFSLGRVDNPNAGAASRSVENAAAAVADAYTKAGAGVDKVFADIGKSITKATGDRIKKAAGDAGKTPKAKAEPRDMSEERSAQIAAQIEQALAEELRARLGMAKEVSERAELERQIARATASAKQSRVDAQIAAIADDKGLSDLKKAELTLELQRLKFIEGGIADIQRRAISEKEHADLAAEALTKAQASRQNQIDLLESQRSLAQSAYEAGRIERRIAVQRYEAERAALQSAATNATLKQSERDIAQQRLSVLDEIHRNELRQLELSDNAVTAYADLVGALSNAARSVIDGDIGGSISVAGGVLRQLSGLAGSGSSLGKSLATAASYAGPIGAAVSAVTGVLGAIGDRSAAKAQAKIDRLTKAVEDLRAENKTSSDSIAGALAQANANWNSDLEYSSAMLTALRSIDAKTGAVAALVARQITTGGLLNTKGLGLGSTSSMGGLNGALSGGLLGGVAGAGLGAAATAATGFLMSGFAGTAAALAGPFGLAVGAAASLVKALTKTKTTTEVLDQGLQFTASTFDEIAKGGVTGSSYADLLTTTKKSLLGIGLSTKVKTSTVSGAIDGDLLSQISGVIQALGEGVLSAAAVFGEEAAKSAEAALGSAVVDLGKLSLKDLKPEEIADVLNATFDKVADQLAAAGVPGLDALADVGEGAFETLTRLAREYQVVDVALASIGKTFGQVGLESIAARDELVKLAGGIDALTSQTSYFAQHFLTDAEQLAPVIKAVNDNLKAYGLSAESTRDQFKGLVLAQDLTTESGRATYAALLAIAPAFDKVATATEDAAKAAKDEADAKDAAAKEAALKAASEATSDYIRWITEVADTTTAANDKLAESIASVMDAGKTASEQFDSLSKSLKDFADSLAGEVTGKITAATYASARANFLAAQGDDIVSAGKAFLDISKSYSTSTQAYQADAGLVRARASSAAASAQQSALDSVTTAQIFAALLAGDTSVLDRLRAARSAGVVGFATGGGFTVGGSGGPDSQLFNLALSPGEMVDVRRPGAGASNDNDMAAVVAELRALRQQTASQAADIAKMQRVLTNVTEDGRAMQTEAAS